jgi:hypothetical protein
MLDQMDQFSLRTDPSKFDTDKPHQHVQQLMIINGGGSAKTYEPRNGTNNPYTTLIPNRISEIPQVVITLEPMAIGES